MNAQAVGSPEASLKYLTPYVFRVAISNSRIVKVEDGKVFFTYKQTGSNRRRTMVLEGMEFLRRFLQHVLPTGFMKVRYFGFLHPNSKFPLEDVRARIELSHGFTLPDINGEMELAKPPVCPMCEGKLVFSHALRPPRTWAGRPSG